MEKDKIEFNIIDNTLYINVNDTMGGRCITTNNKWEDIEKLEEIINVCKSFKFNENGNNKKEDFKEE